MTHRRDLGLIAAAVLVSAAGDLAAVSALAAHLQHQTGSGLVVAALFAANWLAVGAPWGGAAAGARAKVKSPRSLARHSTSHAAFAASHVSSRSSVSVQPASCSL
jgi:hypothetical protein